MASIEELLKANIEALNKNTAAVEKLAEAGLGNVDGGSKTSKSTSSKRTNSKKVEEEEEEPADESTEIRYFYRKSNGQLWETTDAKEIAKLEKARGVAELDEDEYNEMLEKREEELTGKKKSVSKAKSKAKSDDELEDEDEDDDLLDDDEDEEDEVTLDDAKKALTKVKNELGAAEVKKIFKKLGVAKFPEIKEDDAGKAVKLAEAALDD